MEAFAANLIAWIADRGENLRRDTVCPCDRRSDHNKRELTPRGPSPSKIWPNKRFLGPREARLSGKLEKGRAYLPRGRMSQRELSLPSPRLGVASRRWEK
jgi:hypothetical protein